VADLSPAAQAVLDALLNAPVNSGQVCNGKAPQIKLRDISRELWNASSFVISTSGKAAKDNGLALSGEIKSTEEIQHPGSHIMHLSIVWLVARWEDRPPVDGVYIYWLDAISVASIADVVALLRG
jgi:hypothetical protein